MAHALISRGAFQGDLSPLSTKSIIETCVLPILLFGCENWIVSETNLDRLESFLGEQAKRALRWPRNFSNTAAVMAMDMNSVTSEVAVRKLGVLRRQLAEDAVGVGAVAMRSLVDHPNSLCLVRECRELEECFGINYTDTILAGADGVGMREIKRVVRQADRVRQLEKCTERAPLIAEVVCRGGSWMRLWDAALHLGTRHTDGLQALSRMLAHHGRGSKPCPLCNGSTLDPNPKRAPSRTGPEQSYCLN